MLLEEVKTLLFGFAICKRHFFYRSAKKNIANKQMDGLIGGLIKSAAWGVLPISVKILASVVYASTHAKQTYETVQWLSSFIPSPRREAENDELERQWIWINNDNGFELG